MSYLLWELTTAEDPECGPVVFVHPFLSALDQHTNGSGGGVEVSDLQSFHHLPITTYMWKEFIKLWVVFFFTLYRPTASHRHTPSNYTVLFPVQLNFKDLQ